MTYPASVTTRQVTVGIPRDSQWNVSTCTVILTPDFTVAVDLIAGDLIQGLPITITLSPTTPSQSVQLLCSDTPGLSVTSFDWRVQVIYPTEGVTRTSRVRIPTYTGGGQAPVLDLDLVAPVLVAGIPITSVPVVTPDQLAAGLASSSPLAAPFHGARLTAYGHSFGQVQATPNAWPGSVYPARLRDLLHADTSLYANRTINGATMTQIAANAASTWVDGNGGLVTLLGNQNSAGNHIDPATFQGAVRSFLTTMLGATGYPPTVLVIKDVTCTPVGYARYSGGYSAADVAAYNAYLMSVVGEFSAGGWIVVADPLADGYDPSTMTCSDGQHPNDAGMAVITSSCLKALGSAPYRRGLNVGITTTAPVVAAPTAMTIAATPGTAQVSISLASGGAGAGITYALYRGAAVTGSPIATGSAIFPFLDTGRTNGVAAFYTATATNSAGAVTSNTASATPAGATTLLTDTFTRADSATGLGAADTGQTYTMVGAAGCIYGIATGQACKAAGAFLECSTITDVGTGDVDISLTLSVANSAGSGGPVWRAADASNMWVVDTPTTGTVKVYKMVAGAFTAVLDSGVVASSGLVIRVVAKGSAGTLYLGGAPKGTWTDSTGATATKVGFRITDSAGGAVRVDNLSVLTS